MTFSDPRPTGDPAPESLPSLRDVIQRYDLAAKKTLGQHFLLDLNITRRIVRESGLKAGDLALEVGPGPGGLTRALLESGCPVIAVERDQRCIAALEELGRAWPEGRLTLVEGDALETDMASVGSADQQAMPRRIIANLPYNVGTNMLLQWLDAIARARAAGQDSPFAAMALMFQREVAERLVAPTGSKARGRLSIATQWLCQARIAFHLPAAAFTPPPKVASSVILLYPHDTPPFPANWKILQEVTAAAFNQRRKMIRQSLKSLAGRRGLDVAAWLDHAGVRPDLRADALELDQFCLLAESLRILSSSPEQ